MNATVLIGKPKGNDIKENRPFFCGLGVSTAGLKLPKVQNLCNNHFYDYDYYRQDSLISTYCIAISWE